MTLDKIKQLNSERISLLKKPVAIIANKLIEKCDFCVLLVTSSLRTFEEQAQLYTEGRGNFAFNGIVYKPTRPDIVTKALPGFSYHEYGLAFDVAPCVFTDRTPLSPNRPNAAYGVQYESKYWDKIGKLGKELGLQWGGDFKERKDRPHFQFTAGLSVQILYKKVVTEKKKFSLDNSLKPIFI